MTTNLRVRAVPRLCELNPGICLTTEEKARKNLSQGSQRMSQGSQVPYIFVVGFWCHAPAAPYPRERSGTHCTGGWVGLRTGLDRCGKSRPHRDSIPGPPSS